MNEAFSRGGNVPTIFNAANELAVALFLENKISFLQITELIEEAMREIVFVRDPSVDQILETEQATYQFIYGHSIVKKAHH